MASSYCSSIPTPSGGDDDVTVQAMAVVAFCDLTVQAMERIWGREGATPWL